MSRAVFAERFTRTVIRKARAPLAEVAEMIGYQSASAFSVAFTRHAGCSPSAFARTAGS